MGCCVSSQTTQKAQAFESKSPPSLEDQETDIVKEVLPVTPKPLQQEEKQQKPIKKPLQELEKPDRKPYIELVDKETKNAKRFRAEEETTLSEQEGPEACSFSACSESLSTTTTITNTDAATPISNYKRHNVNAKTEDRFYGVSRHHHQELKHKAVRSPSPASRTGRTGVGNRVVGSSPNRRSDASPVKRGGGGGGAGSVGRGRELQIASGNVGPGAPVQVGSRRAGLWSDQNRSDPGERSRRRSSSPASNRSVTDRRPFNRSNNRYAGQITSDTNDDVDTATATSSNGANAANANESLENPLVSLECFIFL